MAKFSPFSATCPRIDKIKSPDVFFMNVKHNFAHLNEQGFFKKLEKPSFFIHRILTSKRSYTGITGYINIEDYIDGNIRQHELTIAEKENRVKGLYKERNGLIKPILLTYPNVFEIDALINRLTVSIRPAYEFTFQGQKHTFWQIDEANYTDRLETLFKEKVPVTYIADGHHRASTSSYYFKKKKEANLEHKGDEHYNFILSTLFPSSEIEVHNFNRVLKHLNGLDEKRFVSKLKTVFKIAKSKSFKPSQPHTYGMYIGGEWYKLSLKESYLEKKKSIIEQLDANIFNEVILNDILGVEDVRRFEGIRYVEGPQGNETLEKKVDGGKAIVAFNIYPMAVENLLILADQGEVLPPKSTWFEPRLRNGFIIQMFE